MADKERLKKLFKQMIDIYSPSGKEKEVVDFLYKYMKRNGLPVIRQRVGEDRDNLLVLPPRPGISLALLGHIDTVTAHDLRNYTYSEELEDGEMVIYGLGTADMKGGCAAMIEAYMSVYQAGNKKPSAALALVVGEEEDGDGTRRLIEEYEISTAIIGEPTNLQPCFSHYGYVEAKITTEGNKRHASLSTPGNNAVEAMLRTLLRLLDYLAEKRQNVMYNIRNLASSESGFAVPPFCEVAIDFHIPYDEPLEEIVLEMQELLEKIKEELIGIQLSFSIPWLNTGYRLPRRGPVFDGIKNIYQQLSLPFKPGSFRSHSDANLLWEIGTKPVILGPGQLEKAHIEEESIPLSQVMNAARIYEEILNTL